MGNWVNRLGEPDATAMFELSSRLTSLRDAVAVHFADEEEGGYFSDILEMAPRFGTAVDELHRQHADFLDRFDLSIAQLDAGDCPAEVWRETSRHVEVLLEELEQHEHREIEIVQSAFDDDLGGGD